MALPVVLMASDKSSPRASLHVDIRPLLHVANVFLLNLDTKKCLKVTISEKSVTIGTKNSSIRVNISDLEFRPNSCTNLQHLPSGICLRLQIKSLSEKILQPLQSGFVINPNVQYNVKCAFCESALLYKGTSFARVLPLPSNSALSESANWFCCQHGHMTLPDLHPREADCFISEESSAVVNSRVVDLSCINVREKNIVQCKRCLWNIGETVTTGNNDFPAFKLFNYAVLFNQIDSASDNNLQNHFAQSFSSLLLSHHKNMTSKLCLTCNKTKSILVWLTDTGILHFSTEFSNDCNNEIDCVPKKTIKVLYLIETDDSQNTVQWESDPAVEILQVPSEFHLNIAKLLLHKTSSLPNELRKIDIYWVAYL